MISCKHFTETVTDAREGKLTFWQRFGHRFHHTICPYCRVYSRGMDATIEILHETPPEQAPEELRAALLEKLKARRGG